MYKYLIVLGMFLATGVFVVPVADASPNGMSRQVIVYRSGAVESFTLRAVDTKAAATCSSNVALQFQETPRSIPPLTVPGSTSIDIDIEVICRADDLQVATVDYSSTVNPAGSVGVTPVQSANLMAGDLVTVSFVVDAGMSLLDERIVTINRSGGQFLGGEGGGFYYGQIPPAAGIVQLAVQGGAFNDGELPTAPPSGSAQEGTQEDIVRFCQQNPQDPLCAALAGSDITPGEVLRIIDAVSPQATTAMPNSVNQLASAQLGNLAMRMADLIGGRSGGFSTSGLNLVGGGLSLPLAELTSVLNAGQADNEERRTLLGGTQWGYWLNGNIGHGRRSATAGNTRFDFDNFSLTTGVDYRFTERAFAGMGLGWSKLNSDYGRGDDGSLNGHSLSLHGYGLYVWPSEFSLDGSISWSNGSYNQRRSMAAIRDLVGVEQGDAFGKTDTQQLSASLGLSWTHRVDAWTLTPQLQYEFIRTNIDAFSETGCASGGQFNYCLQYPRQHIVTRSLSVGSYIDRTFAAASGTFRPYGRLLWFNDGGTGAQRLVANFVGGGDPISVVVDKADRSYGTIELGLGFRRPIGTRTVDFNFGVMSLFGQEHYEHWALRGDVRIPF